MKSTGVGTRQQQIIATVADSSGWNNTAELLVQALVVLKYWRVVRTWLDAEDGALVVDAEQQAQLVCMR